MASSTFGVAPIKAEYLVTRELAECSVNNGDAEAEQKSKGPSTRGMNKNRPGAHGGIATAVYSKDEQLCPSLVNPKEKRCVHGNKCRYQHDIQKYWDSRPPDISKECAVYNLRGYCPYSVACRYAGAHTNPDTLEQITKIVPSPHEPPLNAKNMAVLKKLRKNQINWKKTMALVNQFQPSTSTEPEQTMIEQEPIANGHGDATPIDKPVGPADLPLKRKYTRRDWEGKLYLAPLTTVGNLPFRRLCVDMGVDITCGEMALANSLLKGNKSEWALLRRHPSEKFFGVQLAGGHADSMAKCAQLLADYTEVDFMDMNLGCPLELVCRTGAGCALMNRGKRLRHIVQSTAAVLNDTNIGLTVKMRTGIKSGENTAHSLIGNWLKDCPVDLYTIHGRSKEMRYTKHADWTYVSECAHMAGDIPVFGCGDVLTYEHYRQTVGYACYYTVSVE